MNSGHTRPSARPSPGVLSDVLSSDFLIRNLYVFLISPIHARFRNSSVGIATGHGLDGQGSIPGSGKRFFPSPQRSDRLWGSHSLISHGYRDSFVGVKRSRREAEHSLSSSAEVKNSGAISPFPHTYSWHGA
jgi:hypothetical protein